MDGGNWKGFFGGKKTTENPLMSLSLSVRIGLPIPLLLLDSFQETCGKLKSRVARWATLVAWLYVYLALGYENVLICIMYVH